MSCDDQSNRSKYGLPKWLPVLKEIAVMVRYIESEKDAVEAHLALGELITEMERGVCPGCGGSGLAPAVSPVRQEVCQSCGAINRRRRQ